MRIHVTGASGSGTTTFGRALAAELGVPHFDSDDYFWLPTDPPYTTKRDPEERNRMLRADLRAAGSFVETGSLISWSKEIDALFTGVVFLRIPPEVGNCGNRGNGRGSCVRSPGGDDSGFAAVTENG
jgi:adenylate kinase family enzyme